MKFALGLCAATIFSATIGLAGEVKPQDVNYVDGAVEQSLTGVAGDPAAGEVIMNKGAGNCIACHVVSSLDLAFQGEIGPPLDGVADRWSEAELRGIVANAKIMFEGTMMPAFYKTEGFTRLGDGYTGKAYPEGEVKPLLTGQEIEDVVAFLLTLKEE